MNNALEVKEKQAEKELKQFVDPKREWRRLFAEMWGTFLLVLVACGAVVVSKLDARVSLGMQVAAPGIMVMVGIYFMGTVSGAHLNPGVTFAFALRSHFPWRKVLLDILAQLAGGLLAALFLRSMFGDIWQCGSHRSGNSIAAFQGSSH